MITFYTTIQTRIYTNVQATLYMMHTCCRGTCVIFKYAGSRSAYILSN